VIGPFGSFGKGTCNIIFANKIFVKTKLSKKKIIIEIARIGLSTWKFIETDKKEGIIIG